MDKNELAEKLHDLCREKKEKKNLWAISSEEMCEIIADYILPNYVPKEEVERLQGIVEEYRQLLICCNNAETVLPDKTQDKCGTPKPSSKECEHEGWCSSNMPHGIHTKDFPCNCGLRKPSLPELPSKINNPFCDPYSEKIDQILDYLKALREG